MARNVERRYSLARTPEYGDLFTFRLNVSMPADNPAGRVVHPEVRFVRHRGFPGVFALIQFDTEFPRRRDYRLFDVLNSVLVVFPAEGPFFPFVGVNYLAGRQPTMLV